MEQGPTWTGIGQELEVKLSVPVYVLFLLFLGVLPTSECREVELINIIRIGLSPLAARGGIETPAANEDIL